MERTAGVSRLFWASIASSEASSIVWSREEEEEPDEEVKEPEEELEESETKPEASELEENWAWEGEEVVEEEYSRMVIEPPLPPLEEREGIMRAGGEVIEGVEEVREVIEKREDEPDGIELVGAEREEKDDVWGAEDMRLKEGAEVFWEAARRGID